MGQTLMGKRLGVNPEQEMGSPLPLMSEPEPEDIPYDLGGATGEPLPEEGGGVDNAESDQKLDQLLAKARQDNPEAVVFDMWVSGDTSGYVYGFEVGDGGEIVDFVIHPDTGQKLIMRPGSAAGDAVIKQRKKKMGSNDDQLKQLIQSIKPRGSAVPLPEGPMDEGLPKFAATDVGTAEPIPGGNYPGGLIR